MVKAESDRLGLRDGSKSALQNHMSGGAFSPVSTPAVKGRAYI